MSMSISEGNTQLPIVTENNVSSLRTHFINGVSGMIAGACGVLVGHPFDTIKVRLQVGKMSTSSIARNSRVAELYRGVFPPLLTNGLTQFALFTVYEHTRKLLTDPSGYMAMSHLPATFLAGAIAGSITSYATSPIHLIKVQQQSSQQALTVQQTVQTVVKSHGTKGLLHGSTSVFFVEGAGRGVYMCTYEYLKSVISGGDKTKEGTLLTRATAAAGGNCFVWFALYPLDSIKARRLSDLNSTSSFQCAQHMWRSGGVPAFYRGCLMAMARSVPVAATVLPLYEFCRDKLEKFI